MFDVTALGEGMVEFNQTTPGQPQYLQGFGGDTSNAAIAAARAGARTAYLTRVGDDSFGRALLDLWREEGVDTSAIDADASAPTGLYFVTHGPAGHEFSYRRAGSAAACMSPEWLAQPQRQAVLRASRFLHVSGISLAISPSARETALAAMRQARAQGTRVAFDANLRLKLWTLEAARAGIMAAMQLTDLFLPSLDDVTALTGLREPQAILDWGHAAGAATVVLKLGGQGCIASEGGRRETIRSHAVQPVDATGAGDCFSGNLLARQAAGDDIFTAARYANAAAALAVQGWGAVAPLPRPSAVKALL
ncbi:MAG TPA: sugar kinase [Ramlibacter sp.]|nr:sugar kinase [Ramlibacter sp.]